MKTLLTQFVNEELLSGQDESVDEDTELLMEGIIDSLGVMRLVAYVELEFGIAVPPEDVTIDRFGSISMLAAYLQSLAVPAADKGATG